jgi:hypothetical protein
MLLSTHAMALNELYAHLTASDSISHTYYAYAALITLHQLLVSTTKH